MYHFNHRAQAGVWFLSEVDMRVGRTLMVTSALAGLVACSGPQVNYDYDVKANFAAYKTFDWRPAPGKGAAKGGVFDNAIMDSRVQRAVVAKLEAKGFHQAAGAEPDFLVTAYPIRQGEKSHQVHLGMGFGLGPLGLGVGAPVGDRHADALGSIVLEVQDFRSRAVVWRATAVKVLQASDKPDESEDAVKDAVSSMLKRFPPK
jgi:hypothetical protein